MNSDNQIRVRFAPSPTGNLHLGSLRTAFFNWLFARKNKGKFLIRIEDTDPERSKAEYTESILRSFEWASICSDEPIVIQSQLVERHREVVNKLLEEGKAYRCFCTPQELAQRIGANACQEGSYSNYDEKCRDISNADGISKPFAVRFKVPKDRETISFDDLIHGTLSFPRDQFDDFIILRSDKTPMYNLVVVIDDADMGITHVLRGEEHISNTPKQILLYEACGYKLPKFGHMPFILGPSGHKLSKRDASTAVLDYKNNGFLSAALCNYLVRLGWSHGDQEIFTIEELIEYFSLDHIGKKGAIFDIKKLEWINGVYIRKLSAQQILFYIERDIDCNFSKRLSSWSIETIEQTIELYKDRVKTLKELMHEVELVYHGPTEFNEQELDLVSDQNIKYALQKCQEALENIQDFTVENISQVIKDLCKQLQIQLPQLAKPLRVALLGKSSSPGIFELLAIIGKKTSSMRIYSFKQGLDRVSMKQ